MKQMIKKLQQTKGLNSTVSHEMKAPLMSMMQMIELLIEECNDDYQRKTLESVYCGAKMLHWRVNDLLDSATLD